jgi:hypothetical protein
MEDFIYFFSFQDPNVAMVVIGISLLSISAAMVGTFTFLDKKALLGDAISHGVLPGVCLVRYKIHKVNDLKRQVKVHLYEAAQFATVPVEGLPRLIRDRFVVDTLPYRKLDKVGCAAAQLRVETIHHTGECLSRNFRGIAPRLVARAHVASSRKNLVEPTVTGPK